MSAEPRTATDPSADADAAAGRAALRAGVGSVAPTILGTLAWGTVTGVALVKGGLTAWQALGMVMLVFSGTAQLAALPLIVAGASLPAIWATALLANLRFVVYSATVAVEFRGRRLGERLALGWMTTDSGLAAYVATRRRGGPEPSERLRAARFVGANGAVYAAWSVGTLVGVLLAGRVPASPHLGYIGVLAILALIGPMLATRTAIGVALAAAAVAVPGADWPWRLGTFGAIGAGIAVALPASRRSR